MRFELGFTVLIKMPQLTVDTSATRESLTVAIDVIVRQTGRNLKLELVLTLTVVSSLMASSLLGIIFPIEGGGGFVFKNKRNCNRRMGGKMVCFSELLRK